MAMLQSLRRRREEQNIVIKFIQIAALQTDVGCLSILQESKRTLQSSKRRCYRWQPSVRTTRRGAYIMSSFIDGRIMVYMILKMV